MARLILQNVSVDFPIYDAPARSLKQLLFRSASLSRIRTPQGARSLLVNSLIDIDLVLQDDDRLAVVGANGAGKTTLLRVLGGIYQPTRGEVHCQGRRRTLLDIHSGFDYDANGFENILLRGLLMGLSRAEIDALTPGIASFSGLEDFMHLPVRTYSSGMLFRLLFSISAVVPGEIVLMDEWIGTGDRTFVEKANRSLTQLLDRARIMVLASHHAELLREFCNRAILLEKGRVVAEGTVDEVLERHVRTV